MAVQPGVWGIDLGQCALKAIRMESIDGVVTATAFDYVEHPKILSQPDADPDQLTREALDKFLSRNSLRGDLVGISIPGQSGLARFVKLPPVEEKKIPDIVRFEAKQQIPFNLEEVVWDYQKLNTGTVSEGFAMETEIGLFAIKRDTVNRYLQHFKDVNVEVHVVQMAPLALCNYVSYDLLQQPGTGETPQVGGKKKCVVALDIGADNSNLVITDGDRIIWQRPIPLGGNHFTRALTKDMKLTFAKAEHLKRNATKSPDLKLILGSLKPVLNDFTGEVQRSLGYFTNTHRDASLQYMMGLGNAFRLPGLQKFLSEKLQLDVRRLQKIERLVGDDVVNAPVYNENVLSFAVAYGLAIQGLEVAKLRTNLLPQEIRVERLIRAKKPWAVAAAAALLLGSSMLAVGYNRQHMAVAGEEIKKAMDTAKQVVSTASSFESQVRAEKDKIESDVKAVKSVVIGQEERTNWLQFQHFLNAALPKPDGSNLSTERTPPDNTSAKELFWTSSARAAYQMFLAQQKGTTQPGLKIDEEEWRDDLVQANIESFQCVHTTDLAGYFGRLKSSCQHMMTMKKSDLEKAPEGKGWIVELRGYTYHRGGFRFVTKAIVENLARTPVSVTPEVQLAPSGIQSGSGQTAQGTAGTAVLTKTPDPTPASPAAPAADPSAKPAEGPQNQVSHVVLYRFKTEADPDPTAFAVISERALDALAGTGGGGGGGTMGGFGQMGKDTATGGGGAVATASGGSWTPLGTDGGGGGSGATGVRGGGMLPGVGQGTGGGGGGIAAKVRGVPGTAMGKMGKMGGGQYNPTKTGGGGAMGLDTALPGQPTGTEADGTTTKKKARHYRTEFVIHFIWREPLSKLVQEQDEAPAAAAPTTPGS